MKILIVVNIFDRYHLKKKIKWAGIFQIMKDVRVSQKFRKLKIMDVVAGANF